MVIDTSAILAIFQAEPAAERLSVAIQAARSAFRRFGKGRHPAALNFGDCFSYALAHALGEPLLFVGEDFSLTDLDVASY